jgi:glucose dehydrogenase
MKTQGFLLLALAALASAQGRGGQPSREAPVTNVPFARILGANQEPQNWLTYSGTEMSQRHSALTQITPGNAVSR